MTSKRIEEIKTLIDSNWPRYATIFTFKEIFDYIEKLEKALEFYADEKNYDPWTDWRTRRDIISDDRGKCARNSLNGESGG